MMRKKYTTRLECAFLVVIALPAQLTSATVKCFEFETQTLAFLSFFFPLFVERVRRRISAKKAILQRTLGIFTLRYFSKDLLGRHRVLFTGAIGQRVAKCCRTLAKRTQCQRLKKEYTDL
ncbi:hypothetical protein CEXT_565701 [Caerostris extrusa]|uniref:Secreted protein n=1 Tax=Caerostris extrusa TaxID=172846 RepID=A0AAV4VCC1_CAEEX|nr:hypothetical protein CEXT_565701 [Caerostris extrusa]